MLGSLREQEVAVFVASSWVQRKVEAKRRRRACARLSQAARRHNDGCPLRVESRARKAKTANYVCAGRLE